MSKSTGTLRKTLLLCTILTLSTTFAYGAEMLRFGWGYDVAHEAQIDGYRIYRDGGSIVEADNIPPSARTIEVPRQTDRQNHSYYIVAFVDAEESGVSDIAMDMYSYVVHAVGSFTLEVVK